MAAQNPILHNSCMSLYHGLHTTPQEELTSCRNEAKLASDCSPSPAPPGSIPAIQKPKAARSNVIHLQANGSLAGVGVGGTRLGMAQATQHSPAVILAPLPPAAGASGGRGMQGGGGGEGMMGERLPSHPESQSPGLSPRQAQVQATRTYCA